MNSISKDVSEKVLDNIIKVYGNLFTKEQLEKIESYKRDDEIIKELQLEIINNKDRIDRLSLLLKDRIWIVYKNINYKICPFVTSDHPIVYFNYKNRKTDFNSNGLGITETIIYFPLNREILLALFPKNMYYTPLDDLNDRFQLLNDNAFVMKLNKAQYEQCHRQTYFTFYK
jgi:hypothetical protein